MQPSLSPPPPERRGRLTLIALLAVGFLVASTIAVIEYFQLREANQRIEELESAAGDGGGDQGPFGDVDELLEDLLGEAEGLLEGAGDLGALVECIGSPFGGSGDAGTTVEAIAEQVEGIRELEFEREVEPRFLNDQEMNERVRELFLEEYTPKLADMEERILTTLGAIPPGTDLRELRANAIGQQVAGFYDPETGELVVRQAGAELSAVDRITLAHELDHALTDQALGIPLPDNLQVGNEDADLAVLALAEGDATLVMQRYSASLGFDEQFELLDPEAIAQAEAGLSGFPYYLEQELLFPYEEGLSFVCELYAEGGWEAVNQAYKNPPTSSAQILFSDLYRLGEDPADARNPGTLRKPWRLLATQQLGAANLLWLFLAPGGDRSDPIRGTGIPDPLTAAHGWRGGKLTLWARGEDTALGMTLEARYGGVAFCNAITDWYDRSFEDDQLPSRVAYDADLILYGDQDAVIDCRGTRIHVGIAPDFRTARNLLGV